MTLRIRLLRPRWLTVVLVLWTALWLTLPAPAEGAPLPPASSAPGTPVDGAAIEAGILREALTAQGLSAADVEVVLARLTPAERTELAQRAAEMGVGGDPSLILIVGIVLLIAILLYLPMAGRMQGWW
jgi:hypothetical protein